MYGFLAALVLAGRRVTDQLTRPDVIVVVMDCVRAFDFPGEGGSADGIAPLKELRSESVVFDRGVTVSPWTLPAHATILTGLYPWQHRLHEGASLVLDSEEPTLAGRLADHGYASLLLSANYLVSPDFGLGRGFDACGWGGWWEPFLRMPGTRLPPRSLQLEKSSVNSLERARTGPLWTTIKKLSPTLMNHFALLDSFNRLASWLQDGTKDPLGTPMATWVEPTFERWVDRQDPSRPLFALINLLDAHEPYGSNPRDVGSFSSMVQFARLRQDSVDLNSGDWKAGAKAQSLLKSLYKTSVDLLARRVAELISILKASGRWENTLLILTSDHGQALGEDGAYYHMHSLSEACVRVPIWVRFPYAKHGGTTSPNWTSLIDVAPTVLSAAGVAPPPSMPGQDLGDLIAGTRREPPIVVLDGLGLAHRDSRVRQRLARLDRVEVGVYQEDRRLVVSSNDGTPRLFRVSDKPGPEESIPVEHDPGTDALIDTGRRILGLMVSAPRASTPPDTLRRLASWGYV